MARIRSVHPSLFTDEAWVSCSPLARVLYIGLMTEADDQGLFEWKPLQIRMRLLPGDGAEIPPLLAELVAVNLIAELESAGKKLGAIRYFRRFQRPKKPNAVFVLPPEWRTYVGLSDDGSELADDDAPPVPNRFPTGVEIAPQMEDGGGRKEEEISEADASSPPSAGYPDGFEACWKAYPHVKGRSSKTKAFGYWRRIASAQRERLLAAVGRYARDGREPKEECGAPAMERWLRDSRFLDWMEEDATAAPRAPWTGPAELRRAVAAKMGEDWTASWLDPCEWDEEAATLLAPRDLTVTHLERSVRRQLVDGKVNQVRVKGRAA